MQRRQHASQQTDCCEHGGPAQKGKGVLGRYFEKQRARHPSQTEGDRSSQQQSGHNRLHPLTNDEEDQLVALCAECRADAEFGGPAGHRMSDEAVNADSGQRKTKARENR